MAAPREARGALVLGIGNLLWADEGFGVRAVEALHQRFELPAGVSLVDGGTQGLYLLDAVCSAADLLVFDAIDYGLAPGTLRVLRDAEVPVHREGALSLHQASFMELLSLAQWRGRFPARLTVIGVQPAVLDDLGGSLSPPVRGRIDEALRIAVAELSTWGYAATRRDRPPAEALHAGALATGPYEDGRPDGRLACRTGDARFLNQVHRRRSDRCA